MLIGNNFICLLTTVFGSSHSFDALLKALHLLANFALCYFNSFLASISSPCKIACFCWKSRSCYSNSEILWSALCFSNWKIFLSEHKCESNSEHSDVFKVRSSCSCEIETCKTGQFSKMKLVGLACDFGFLAASSPSEFLLTSGILGKIKGPLHQPILFLEKLDSFSYLFFFNVLEKFKALLSPCMQGQFGGARSCK